MFPIFAGSNPSGYNLTRSLRFRASASASLSRTPAVAGNRQTFTISTLVKRGALGSYQRIYSSDNAVDIDFFRFTNTDTIQILFTTSASPSPVYASLETTAVFRDPAAWYQIVLSIDTTQATAANRVRLYVNNVLQTISGTYPAQNFQCLFFNTTNPQYISRSAETFDGYLTEINFVNAQALTPSSFGSTNALTGVWQPAAYTGTYGTNGFELQFTDNSAATAAAIGKDSSGNGNNWTPNNISVTAGITYDSMTDVPTLTSATAANFAVLNPLWKGANITLSAANLNASMSATSDASFSSTITITSGKWYWESVITSPSTDYPYIGVATPNFNYQAVGGSCIRSSATGFFKASNATKWNLSSSSYGSSFVANDVMMIAYDADGGKIYFGKNGTWDASSDPAAGTSPAFTGVNAPVTPAGFVYNCSWIMNFGQRPFAYTPPTGFVALNTFNLPTSTIVKGNTVMDATLYTGTLLSNAVTNAASFKPDLVWLKSRSAATDHELTDSVRGVTKSITSNSTAAEATDVQGLTAFNTNGFTVGTNTNYNNLAATYVGWQWQAGQGTNTTNTSGTITSTVSVNASAGFSVVTYTGTNVSGATIGHGLGVAPSLIIIKNRSSVEAWPVYHSSVGATKYLVLNTNAAEATSSTPWNNTAPTSTVFSLGNWNALNENGSNHVAYCWTPIAGFSAFGSYTGNGSTDGPFVYTGFRPKFVMIKRTNNADPWLMWDSARGTYNVQALDLEANNSNAEVNLTGTSYDFDFLSNGVKFRGAGAAQNASGGTYVYMAFAENPFKNSLAR